VLPWLEPASWYALRVVCGDFKRALSEAEAVVGLASGLGVALPNFFSGGRATRSRMGDPFLALSRGLRRKRRADARAMDSKAWTLWLRMHDRDVVGALRKAMEERGPALCFHGLSFYGDRTLLMLAAWRGRLKCVKLLVDHYRADVDAVDEHNFSPLLFAAWANHLPVVRYLLRQNAVDVNRRGEPPLSSSCGGRGHRTALDWATRKGHNAVAALLKAHGATE